MNTPTSPIDSEMRAPWITRESMSRPSRSVPSRNASPPWVPKKCTSVRKIPHSL